MYVLPPYDGIGKKRLLGLSFRTQGQYRSRNGTIAKVIIQEQFTYSFNIRSELKQGDALSTAIFNLVLHSIAVEVSRGGTIKNNLMQISAYADEVVIIARSIDVLKKN